MPYLSKIPINPLRRAGQRMVSNPHVLHAAVLGGLPPPAGRMLWRDEVTHLPSGAVSCELLVLTPRQPDWSHLVEQAGWETPEGAPLIRDLQPLLDLVVGGREFGFRVRANPVASTKAPQSPPESYSRVMADGGPRRGMRVSLRSVSRQLDWFMARSNPDNARWGFVVDGGEVPSVAVAAREHRSFIKAREARRRVTLDRVTFEGRLRVTDPVRLREVLVDGLGGAKAYGCGLLTLAPVVGDVVAG